MPKPTTNEVQELIPKWLDFCARLGLDTGGQTNLTEVDWVETVLYRNAHMLERGDLYDIKFKNGAGFLAVHGKVFSDWSGRGAFSGAWAERKEDYWKQFAGTPTKDWKDLSNQLNRRLIEHCGIPEDYLANFEPRLYVEGSGGVTRCVVRWCDRGTSPSVASDRVKTVMIVEFDLATGQIHSLRFDDPALVKWEQKPVSNAD